LKILLITNLCSPYRVGLFELLHKMYDIRFLFFSSGEESYYDGERLLGDFRGGYLKGFNLLPKVRINPGLIRELLFSGYTHLVKCINGPVPLLASFLIAKLRGKKFILWTGIWNHPDTLFHRISFPFTKFLYRQSDAIVVYGSHVKRYLVSLGIPAEKVAIGWQVQDNAKFERIATEEEKRSLREALGIHTRRVILFVGRLVDQKGIRLLLQAFRAIGNDDVSLLLVGRGPLEEVLKNEASVSGRVFLVPRVPGEELYRYYAITDIFVLPSVTTNTIKETWGFVVNEAMCQGCAIVTSDAVGAGVGGLVEEGVNGYVVPENDVPALADALRKILSDEERLTRMKKASKEIIKNWTYPKMAAGFSEALRIADGDIVGGCKSVGKVGHG